MTYKVLLAEDDLFLMQLYTDILKAESYDLDTAHDGAEAYEKIKAGNWDLVLLDMYMPGMTGVEVVSKIKSEMPQLPYKKIVFLTNSDNLKDIENIKKVSDGILKKSDLNPAEFIDKVKTYL